MSGHGCLIGYETGKILSYAARSKRCSMCGRGKSVSDHDCRKNFTGSAKRMEADMAVQLITKNTWLSEENTHITVLIADDDSSTISAVRCESSHPIVKWSSKNSSDQNIEGISYQSASGFEGVSELLQVAPSSGNSPYFMTDCKLNT